MEKMCVCVGERAAGRGWEPKSVPYRVNKAEAAACDAAVRLSWGQETAPPPREEMAWGTILAHRGGCSL